MPGLPSGGQRAEHGRGPAPLVLKVTRLWWYFSLFTSCTFLAFPQHCCSVALSCLTPRPHGLQHSSLPCPPPFPRVCSNSSPLSQWTCYFHNIFMYFLSFNVTWGNLSLFSHNSSHLTKNSLSCCLLVSWERVGLEGLPGDRVRSLCSLWQCPWWLRSLLTQETACGAQEDVAMLRKAQ